MRHLKHKVLSVAALSVAAMGVSGVAQATVLYNQSLVDGVYYGSGNSGDNANWAVDTDNGIELGLRAHLRQLASAPSDASGLYGSYNAGTQTVPSANPARATWNYDFSIDLGSGSGDTFQNTDLTFTLCVTGPAGLLTPACVSDLFTRYTDNGQLSNANGVYAIQNSEQLLFGDSVGNNGYDIFATGVYTFTLTATDDAGVVLAATRMDVRVPEPASLALVGLGLLGLGVSRRKRA